MRNTLLIGLLLVAHLTCGQQYRVGLCPGPLKAYLDLVKDVQRVPATDMAPLLQIEKHLITWSNTTKLKRYRVEIKQPETRKTWVWQKPGDGKTSVFAVVAAVESTAGRGSGLRAGRSGDNQRCFFRDTTVVVDTLRIRRGDFAETTLPALAIDGQTYTLPLSNDRTEWLLSTSVLPGLKPGQYHAAMVQLGEGEPLSMTLYVLAPEERQQLVQSVQNWVSFEPMDCQQLGDQLVAYLAQNWGGKTCAGSALYAYAQRTTLTRLLQQHHVTCAR